MGEDYITPRAAGEVTGYSQQHITSLARRAIIGAKRYGRFWLVHRGDLLEYARRASSDNTEDARYGPR